MNKKSIFKTIAVCLICMIFSKVISFYINKPPIDIELSNLIRPISWNFTKEDIYIQEDREPDNSLTSGNVTLFIYDNEKLDEYSGSIRYGFDENGKFISLGFEFDSKSDFNNYIKDFQAKYSKPAGNIGKIIVWKGHADEEIAYFGVSHQTNVISIDLYYE